MATGKKKGDKRVSGDRKTPEGVYNFQRFLPAKELLRRYVEKKVKSTVQGHLPWIILIRLIAWKENCGGIWLHSTNDESRIQKGLDSRGCVVVSNVHLKEISTYMSLQRTPIIVVERIHYLKKDMWLKDVEEIKSLVMNWSKTWENEDLKGYISHHDPVKFHSPTHGKLSKVSRLQKSGF